MNGRTTLSRPMGQWRLWGNSGKQRPEPSPVLTE